MPVKKESTFELIRKCLLDEENADLVQLNTKQKDIMERWNYAIELRTCEHLNTKDIVMKIMERFEVERFTAMNDIGNAEALFGYSTTMNKRYRIGARIEYLEEKLQQAYQKDEWKAAAMMEAVLQKYYLQYPEIKKQETPRNFRFEYTPDAGEKLMDALPGIEDAEFILNKNEDGE